MTKQPLELAADHLNSIDSAWGLDINILKAGFNDLVKRLEKLEQEKAVNATGTATTN